MIEPLISTSDRVECHAAKDPAVRLFIGAAILLGMAAYCAYDGYVQNKYPYRAMSEDINGFFSWAFNCIGPFVFGPAGLILLGMGVRFTRRTLVADTEGIGYIGGPVTAWSQIEQLDASRLQSKGFLDLITADGRKIILDSWKLQNFRNMVAFIEKQIPAERHKI